MQQLGVYHLDLEGSLNAEPLITYSNGEGIILYIEVTNPPVHFKTWEILDIVNRFMKMIEDSPEWFKAMKKSDAWIGEYFYGWEESGKIPEGSILDSPSFNGITNLESMEEDIYLKYKDDVLNGIKQRVNEL